MTEQDILADRARLYAKAEQGSALDEETRCLEVEMAQRRWLFPESAVRLLLPEVETTRLPVGVRWGGWPCSGLVCHSLTTLPVICWSALTEHRELAPDSDHAVLLLRVCPVALRVPGMVSMANHRLHEPGPDEHPWSAGRVGADWSLANVVRLLDGGR